MKINKVKFDLYKESFKPDTTTVIEAKTEYIDPFRFYSEFSMKERNLHIEKAQIDKLARYSPDHRGWEVNSVTMISFHTRCETPVFRLVCPKLWKAYSVIDDRGDDVKLPKFFQPSAEDPAVIYVLDKTDQAIATILAPNRAELNNVANAISDIIDTIPNAVALRSLPWLEVARTIERFTPARIINHADKNINIANNVIGWKP